MTIQEATQYVKKELTSLYDEREAGNITALVMENITQLKKIDRIFNKQNLLSKDSEMLLKTYVKELLEHKPVQYVLNECWFAGMKLFVNEHVLIPRPETEELADWVATETAKISAVGNAITMLDVGTGSGCLAIALKKRLPEATVFACDISGPSLEVARRNAADNLAEVNFEQCDFLDDSAWNRLPAADIIVSNPPYIPLQNSESMHDNVLRYEPHLALFVPDDEPLLFYRAITSFARTHLSPQGSIYVEIQEDLAKPVLGLFSGNGFSHLRLKQDLQGKDRMISASRVAQ
jgi:release factor glutamine methyltransferase